MFKKIILLSVCLVVLAGIFYLKPRLNNPADGAGNGENQITVFKSPTCSCCAGYIDYLKDKNFAVKTENVRDTLSVKEKFQIPTELESCHTSAVGNYFIEGHVPVEIIKKLLSEKPDVRGIALPGMPEGAPGMGGKSGHFTVYQLSRDGNISEYASF